MARSFRFLTPSTLIAIVLLALVSVQMTYAERSPAAPTAIFIVNTTSHPGDGTCDSTECTLNEAISAANAATNGGTPDEIHFAIPGTGPHTIALTSSLPTITDPVIIDGYTQSGASENTNLTGGSNAVLMVELSGHLLPPNQIGLWIQSGGTTIRGLAINRFANSGDLGGYGIWLEVNGNNAIEGNFIGTDPTGTTALGNGNDGIFISNSSSSNTIGGTDPAARNVISGNDRYGLLIYDDGVDNNVISGNLIGTNSAGTAALGNTFGGIYLLDGPAANIIGGTTFGSRNVISGNGGAGVSLINSGEENNVVGNFIGTDVDGTLPMGNGGDGARIQDASGNTIGGSTSGAGNLISANGDDGVDFANADANFVQGNKIGTDVTGTADLGNGDSGMNIFNSNDNIFGGIQPGAGNLIAFNQNIVFDDRAGIRISGASEGNSILANSFFSNVGLGIDLAGGTQDSFRVTANDPGDGDTGPNTLQNYPVLDGAFSDGVTTVITGTLNSNAGSTFRIEFFSSSACDLSGYGEGESYLGFRDVTTNTSGNSFFGFTISAVNLPPGRFVTTTVTDLAGNTSEFSACEAVTGDPPADLNYIYLPLIMR